MAVLTRRLAIANGTLIPEAQLEVVSGALVFDTISGSLIQTIFQVKWSQIDPAYTAKPLQRQGLLIASFMPKSAFIP